MVISHETSGDEQGNLSRREVLHGAGGAIAVGAVTGTASADGTEEFNVGFANQRGKAAAERAASSTKREFNFQALTIRAGSKAAKKLENNPNIRYVEENGEMRALKQTTPYGIEVTDADLAIGDGDTGNGVSVAVLDTGIDAQHEDLEANLGEGKAIVECSTSGGCRFGGGNDIGECLEPWDDDNDHGSHCSGTVGTADNSTGVLGVAPDVTLHAVKVLDRCGSGSFDNIAAGIEWSAHQGHEVQSMSLGADTDSEVVKEALAYAAERNVVMVAAGNDGPCSDCVGFPARDDRVIAVSATDENDELADFSSTGPEVELAAPGVDVDSTVPRDDYELFSGTSMACPHVSGGAAQVIADVGTDSYERGTVRQTLKDAATDIGLGDTEQGAGRLDVDDATGGDGGGNSAPAVDSLSAGEVETDTDGAEFDADWAVSDSDSNLETVELTLTDDTDGETEDTATVDVSGDTASGTTRLVAAGDDGSGNDYTVEAVVTDTDGATGSDTTTATETEDTESALAVSTGDATNVGTDSATLNGSLDDLGGADSADVYFEWGPSGNLSNTTDAQTLSATGGFSDEVTGLDGDTEYEFRAVAQASDGDTDTGATNNFTTGADDGGESADGIHELQSRRTNVTEIRLTVVDGAGNETSEIQTV